MLTLCFDGLYRSLAEDEDHLPRAPHAGVMCYGWLITRSGKLIARGHGGYVRGEDATSNIAEYLALIEGLGALCDMGLETEAVEIIGDARSVIDQMQGQAAVNSLSTKPVFRRAQRLARRFTALQWTWTPRRKNHAADLLTRRAMKQIQANPLQYRAALQAVQNHTTPHSHKQPFFPLLDLRVFQPLELNI
jgi:ribonuclease HI